MDQQPPSEYLGKLLIVEDEEEVRAIVKGFIQSSTLNVEILEATNGHEALELAHDPTISVVLSDVRMPEMDGLQFARELKNVRPEVQVIFLSGFADEDLTLQMLKLGAIDLLEKPASREEIVASVRSALQKNEGNIFSNLHRLRLNPRQNKVLDLILRGASNKEIGRHIGLSEQGVKYNVSCLLKRFGATHRLDLRDKIWALVSGR